MLIIARRMPELNTTMLMEVYAQSNQENGMEFYPDLSPAQQVLRVEERFLSYLREDFFRQKGVFYAVLAEGDQYLAALRLEPFDDGLLLEALETHPDFRRQGYGTSLIRQVLGTLETGTKVYSHVSKRNKASLATHHACDFVQHKDFAVSVDGTITSRQVTLLKII